MKIKCIVCKKEVEDDPSLAKEAYICPKCWLKLQPTGKQQLIHDGGR